MSKSLTKAAALAALKKLNYSVSDDGYGENFYDGMEYCFSKNRKKLKSNPYSGYSWEEWDEDATLGLSTGSATYCCGIPEMGNYALYGDKRKGVTTAEVVACIEYVKANEGTGYLRVTSTSQRKDVFWNNAFKAAGFKKRITLPSKHGEGRYKVYMWEWWDETRHKDA